MGRDIIIKPNRNTTGTGLEPVIYFSGETNATISLKVNDDGSVVFVGSNGDITNINNSNLFVGGPIITVPSDIKFVVTGNSLFFGSISATTFYGDGSGLSGITISGITGLQSALDLKTDLSLFNLHTGDTNNPHQTSLGNLFGGSAHTHTISEIINLQSSLDLKTDLTLFSSHTANTSNPHQTSFYQLISTAHTHTISDINDLSNQLNSKFSISGGTVNGDVLVLGNVTILGSATTINTSTLSIADNVVTLNSNITGGTPFPGHSGIEVLRGSGTTAALLWEEQRSQWEAGLHGSTKRIILEGDSLALLNSGHTHPISEITGLQSALDLKTDLSLFSSHTANTNNPHQTSLGNLFGGSAHTHTISEVINLQTNLNNKFNTSGGTISGDILVTGSVSATTFYGNGQYLTGLVTNDFYVTGGTFSGGTLTLNRQNGSVTITGFTSVNTVDTFVTGFTYSNNNLTISQNQGQLPISVNISTMTGLTVNGNISATTMTTTTPLPSDNSTTVPTTAYVQNKIATATAPQNLFNYYNFI